MRIQKYMADCGVASRRKSEEIILEGRVMVNGVVIKEPGFAIEPGRDNILVDGRAIRREKHRYIMLHKPVGYITTVSDPEKRRTVMELMPDIKERLYPVGRLDADTSGLLLLTNDGEWANKLMHPRHEIEKTYRARVNRPPSEVEMQRFKKGLFIEHFKTAPAKIQILKSGAGFCLLEIIIHEGRNRQVRKMLEAIGLEVESLRRTGYGQLKIGDLAMGAFRELTVEEAAKLVQ